MNEEVGIFMRPLMIVVGFISILGYFWLKDVDHIARENKAIIFENQIKINRLEYDRIHLDSKIKHIEQKYENLEAVNQIISPRIREVPKNEN